MDKMLEQVLLVQVKLDGKAYSEKHHVSFGVMPDGKKIVRTMKDIEAFLKRYPTARVLVVVSTHSLDDGYFVWKGSTRLRRFEGCHLGPVGVL